MYAFSRASLDKLNTVCGDLQGVASLAINASPIDFMIVHGWRDQATQDELVRTGMSKTPWPTSKHNHQTEGAPDSLALDFAPVIGGAIPWQDSHAFAVIAGVFFAMASQAGVTLRWGGDWDMDGLTTDQTFMDWGHLEIVDV